MAIFTLKAVDQKKAQTSCRIHLHPCTHLVEQVSSIFFFNECIPKQWPVLKRLYRFAMELKMEQQNQTKEHVDEFKRFGRIIKHYYVKLQIYEKILQCRGDGTTRFDPDFYRSFRDKCWLQLAIEYAHQADIPALRVLCQEVGDMLFCHYLVILSHLPETVSPMQYRDLIEFIISKLLSGMKHSPPTEDEFEFDFYANNPDCLKFKLDDSVTISDELLTAWFEFRSRQILNYTCLVGNSLELLEIGIQQHKLPLEHLYTEMDLYSLLIYDGCGGRREMVPFEDFEKLSITEKINLFFDNDDGDWNAFKHLFERFFEKIAEYAYLRMVKVTKKDLLKEFFVNLAQKDFEKCLKIFETYTMVDKTFEEIKQFKIINDPSDLIELAVASIEAYQNPDQLDVAFRIMECLPDKDQADFLVTNDDPDSVRRFQLANEQADEIEYCLSIVELLKEYRTEVTVKELKSIANSHDKKQMLAFIEKVLNNFCKLDPTERDDETFSEWKIFFLNLKDLKKKYLKLVSDEELVETTVKCLLLSYDERFIEIAFNHIDLESAVSGKRLERQKGKTILKMVAKDYLKFADPAQDDNIRLAKRCLEYIREYDPDDVEVNDELDFIRALDLLYEKFDFYSVLPIKIRTMSESDLIETILSSSKDAHTKFGFILEICYLLKIFSELTDQEREARLMTVIGQKAIEHGNYAVAMDLCKSIMDRDLRSAWRLCHDTPMMPDIDSYLVPDQKLRMVSFALAHCPDSDLNVHYKLLNIIQNIKQNHLAEHKVFIKFRGEGEQQPPPQPIAASNG